MHAWDIWRLPDSDWRLWPVASQIMSKAQGSLGIVGQRILWVCACVVFVGLLCRRWDLTWNPSVHLHCLCLLVFKKMLFIKYSFPSSNVKHAINTHTLLRWNPQVLFCLDHFSRHRAVELNMDFVLASHTGASNLMVLSATDVRKHCSCEEILGVHLWSHL